MPWRTPRGDYLLEGPTASFPIHLESMQLPGGEVLTGAPTFYLATPEGRVTEVYGGEPQAASVEDTMYVTPIYAVAGGRLVEYLWVDKWDRDAQEIKEQRCALSELTACAADALPFDPATVLAANIPARLTYSVGNEHNPMHLSGRSELAIKPNGEARLEHHARFAQVRVWTGRAAPEVLDQLWAALKRAGFPHVAEHPVPADATIRKLRAETGAAQRSAYVEWNAAKKLPGYDEAFAILDAMIGELSEETVKLTTDRQLRIVNAVERQM